MLAIVKFWRIAKSYTPTSNQYLNAIEIGNDYKAFDIDDLFYQTDYMDGMFFQSHMLPNISSTDHINAIDRYIYPKLTFVDNGFNPFYGNRYGNIFVSVPGDVNHIILRLDLSN